MTAAFRLFAGSGGLDWPQVLALLAREAETPMGRELAAARSSTDLPASGGRSTRPAGRGP
jgi:hypothetical protein